MNAKRVNHAILTLKTPAKGRQAVIGVRVFGVMPKDLTDINLTTVNHEIRQRGAERRVACIVLLTGIWSTNMKRENRIPESERDLSKTILDPIYMAARDLMSEVNTKTSALTAEESKMAVAVTLYCGSHKDNLFAG